MNAQNHVSAWKKETRIVAGFSVATIAITMVLGVLVYTRLRMIETAAARITQDAIPSIYLSGALRDAIQHRDKVLLDYVNADDQATAAALDADADYAAKSMTSALNWSSTGILVVMVFGLSLLGVALNVRKRLRVERELREGEERFRAVFENAPFAMCVTGLDGRFIQANTAFCEILKYSKAELLATTWKNLIHPDDLEPALHDKEDLNPAEPRRQKGATFSVAAMWCWDGSGPSWCGTAQATPYILSFMRKISRSVNGPRRRCARVKSAFG
jgi:PAS domain-containing protein